MSANSSPPTALVPATAPQVPHEPYVYPNGAIEPWFASWPVEAVSDAPNTPKPTERNWTIKGYGLWLTMERYEKDAWWRGGAMLISALQAMLGRFDRSDA